VRNTVFAMIRSPVPTTIGLGDLFVGGFIAALAAPSPIARRSDRAPGAQAESPGSGSGGAEGRNAGLQQFEVLTWLPIARSA
jgi:sugar/nucleoside kinase (ribokinase family)